MRAFASFRTCCGIASVVLSLMMGSAPQRVMAMTYTITDLGALGGTESKAYGVNDLGEVVGCYSTGSFDHAFYYDGTGMTDLGTFGGTHSYAHDINNSSQIVGRSFVSGNAYHTAVLWEGGTATDLGALGGTYSNANSINENGQIAGWANTTGNAETHAFRRDGTTMVDLGQLGNYSTYGRGINSSGDVVGTGYVAGNLHAFLHDGTGMVDLLGAIAQAQAINDSGQIVGEYEGQAFLWSGGTATKLGALGGTASWAYGINNDGDLVGWAGLPGNSPAAFLYDGTQMLDLNDLIPAGSGWFLEEARDISDAGHIVGWGTNPAGDTHAYLLTPEAEPIPEPLTMAGLMLGVGSLAGYVRRRRNG